MTADCCIEALLWRRGVTRVAGLDEAGRGSWAGPIVASAVVLPADPQMLRLLVEPRRDFAGVRDSKQISRAQREAVDAMIRAHAVDIGIGVVPVEVIDKFGIDCAGQLAFSRALARLQSPPQFVLVDGFPLWSSQYHQLAVIDGDARCVSIAAASVVAKVARDAMMRELDLHWPAFGFAQNCGYGTPAHRAALMRFGPSPQHRMSFGPVAAARLADHE